MLLRRLWGMLLSFISVASAVIFAGSGNSSWWVFLLVGVAFWGTVENSYSRDPNAKKPLVEIEEYDLIRS